MAKRLATDRYLMGFIVALLVTGILVLWSATAPLSGAGSRANGSAILGRQGLWALVGTAVMALCLRIDYRVLKSNRVSLSILALAVTLLIVALLSPAVNETNRWIRIAGTSFQPSEFAKIAVVIFLASQLEQRAASLASPRTLLAPGLGVGLVAFFVYLEPDFGSAVHIALVAAAILWVAGAPKAYFGAGLAGGLVLGALGIAAAPYRVERLLAFRDPWAHAQSSGYQAVQSLIALGSGGATGRGFMRGEQKASFLPYPYSDFIFSVVGEEHGFAGTVSVVALFMALLFRGLRAARNAPDMFGRLLAAGLVFSIVSQAFINMSVAVSLFPTKGIPLPFFSAGGTSLILCLLSVGLILNVSQHAD